MRGRRDSALPRNILKKLDRLGRMDIVAGIPSYNCAHTINYVIYQTVKGLEKSFPDKKAAVIVSDGGSSDGTLNVVKAMKLPGKTKLVSTHYVGISGKGTALKAIFEAMMYLEAQAVIMVDSDLRSITPQWIELLISPTLEGTGLVTPFYTRHKYDGTITNFLCYPFTRALYGKRVRQPIGGDFGLSRELVEKLLNSGLWRTPYVPRFGIDIFITHTALGEGLEVKQTFLGSKIHETKDPSKHLASMFYEVAGSMFSCAESYESAWRSIQGSKPVKVIKGDVQASVPEEIQVDHQKLLQTYVTGFKTFRSVYEKVLTSELVHTLDSLSTEAVDQFRFPTEYWAKCAYSFASFFRKTTDLEKRNTLLEALRILWLGKVAGFVFETRESDAKTAEKEVEKVAKVFEELKSYLLDRYSC